MKKALGSIIVLVMFALPASAQKVYVDYDRTADFDQYKTFAWGQSRETSVRDTSPLMDSRIKNSIEFQLTEIGMVEDLENPDIYVTYHTDEKQEMRLNTTNFGYGYGGGWGWDPYWGGGMGSSSTTVHNYTRGTLIIDLWDTKTEEVVWRGTAESVVPSNPEKEARKIDKALKKMVKRWEKMYKSGK